MANDPPNTVDQKPAAEGTGAAAPLPVPTPEQLAALWDWAQGAYRNIPDLNERLVKLEKDRQDRQSAETENFLFELLKHIKTYTNLLLVLGYGGILAIWTESQAIMQPPAFIGAGAAVILSLLLFIIGEVVQTRMLSEALRSPDDSRTSELNKAKKRADTIAGKLYWPVLGLGFGGGAVIFLCYAGNLIATAAKAWG